MAGWRWLYKSPEEASGITAGVRKPMWKALNQNELLLTKVFRNPYRVKTYPVSIANPKLRVNGLIGIEGVGFDVVKQSLTIHKRDENQSPLNLQDILAWPGKYGINNLKSYLQFCY